MHPLVLDVFNDNPLLRIPEDILNEGCHIVSTHVMEESSEITLDDIDDHRSTRSFLEASKTISFSESDISLQSVADKANSIDPVNDDQSPLFATSNNNELT